MKVLGKNGNISALVMVGVLGGMGLLIGSSQMSNYLANRAFSDIRGSMEGTYAGEMLSWSAFENNKAMSPFTSQTIPLPTTADKAAMGSKRMLASTMHFSTKAEPDAAKTFCGEMKFPGSSKPASSCLTQNPLPVTPTINMVINGYSHPVPPLPMCGSIMLGYGTSNLTACTLTSTMGDNMVVTPAGGNLYFDGLVENTQYTINCTGPSGNATQSIIARVNTAAWTLPATPKVRVAGGTASASDQWNDGGYIYAAAFAIQPGAPTDFRNYWNSGDDPNQWIEVDWGASQPIKEMCLQVAMSPSGNATHRIRGGNSPNPFSNLATLSGFTVNSSWVHPVLPGGNIRYTRILTTSSPSWVAWGRIRALR